MNQEILWLGWTGLHMTPWKLIGMVGALMFGARWLVQFIASKRAQKPVIPRLFWYMSIVGSLMTLSYFLFSSKQDAVGVLQNLFPAFTAIYSLYLDIRNRGWNRQKSGPDARHVAGGDAAATPSRAVPSAANVGGT
jgi:lipid-A-disaccharide synthase-like uncharacterized protein